MRIGRSSAQNGGGAPWGENNCHFGASRRQPHEGRWVPPPSPRCAPCPTAVGNRTLLAARIGGGRPQREPPHGVGPAAGEGDGGWGEVQRGAGRAFQGRRFTAAGISFGFGFIGEDFKVIKNF